MKFGKQLELGTYGPWREYYIQYGRLKRIIKKHRFLADKAAEKEAKELQRRNSKGYRAPSPSIELTSPQIRGGPSEFTPLTRDTSFSQTEKIPIVDESADFFPFITKEIERVNKFFVGKLAELRVNLDLITAKRQNPQLSHHTSSETELFRIRDLYIELMALQMYSELNKTAFYKIIKKYDKVMIESTLDSWLPQIDIQPFAASKETMHLIDIVTGLVSRDKLIGWDLFAKEQKTADEDDVLRSVRLRGVAISLTLFALTLLFPLESLPDPVACRCLSLLVLVVSLWITEAIPYYATALCIPVLVVVMKVLKNPSNTKLLLTPEAAAEFVTASMFNHTTFLLLGGYAISSAFSRCQLELRMASILQEKFGHQPKLFILNVMLVGLFLSAWISNHTAPILCASIIMPIVRDLPTESRFSKTLLLGLAFACNFGGMLTPISSLQNVLASASLEQAGFPISFGRWILVAFPFGLLCTVVAWLVLVMIMRPDDISTVPVIVYERDAKIFGKRNVTVMSLSLLAVLLFATSSLTTEIFGDISIISITYLIVMYGSGMLSEVDFNSMSWHTLCLVGGGNVLGKAVASSGLLSYIATTITSALPLNHPWIALLCILVFCGSVATFVSHTVAAIILMPIILQLGVVMDIPVVVVIGAAWSVSAAMALPFSSFPNVNSLLIVDDFQKPYLNVHDFIWSGGAMSMIAVVLISTLGFMLISVAL